MKTILHIVGNRPQFIKLAILHKELSGMNNLLQKIIHTGQHSSAEMSEIFFSELLIPAVDKFLPLQNTGNSDSFIAETATQLQQYFDLQPDSIVFTYGDTNTTLAAAIAARRCGLPLFHFEAGIRTGDDSMPEEINRIITDRIATTNYCCTQKNYSTMVAEGHSTAINSHLLLTGDLMYDAFLKTAFAEKNVFPEKNYVAVTIHRLSNILSPITLTTIIETLNKLHTSLPVFMPVHPHTKKRIMEYGLKAEFFLLNPMGYPAMKTFLLNSDFVVTDSGGVAREAFFCKKRSLIIMEKPFWPEIIDAGCSINTASQSSYESFLKLPALHPDFESPIFGNGNAAKLIKEDILTFSY